MREYDLWENDAIISKWLSFLESVVWAIFFANKDNEWVELYASFESVFPFVWIFLCKYAFCATCQRTRRLFANVRDAWFVLFLVGNCSCCN